MSRGSKWLVAMAIVGFVAAFAALTIDMPVARWVSSADIPGDVARMIDYSEVFGHGMGVTLIIVTASTLDWRGWKTPAVLATYAFASGLIADAVKLLVARHRPYDLDLSGSVQDSFIAWFPGFRGVTLEPAVTSFPSAHTAVAFGLAIGLSRIYPRGRFLFAGFALLSATQRIAESAHFCSDVLFGGALACLIGALLAQDGSFAGRWLEPAP